MTESQKKLRLKELYPLALSSAQTPPPKRSLFTWKCPKCGNKLSKESVKDGIFSGEGADEFANKVVKDAGVAPGLYNLHIEHFTCKCGYEFAKRTIEDMPDTTG